MITAARRLGVLVAFYGVLRKCIQFILGALTVNAKKIDFKGSSRNRMVAVTTSGRSRAPIRCVYTLQVSLCTKVSLTKISQ